MDTVLEFSQQMDFITILVMCVPLMAVSLCGLLFTNDKKRSAMQRYTARLYNICKTLHNYHQHDNYEQQSEQYQQYQYQQQQTQQQLQLQQQQQQQQQQHLQHQQEEEAKEVRQYEQKGQSEEPLQQQQKLQQQQHRQHTVEQQQVLLHKQQPQIQDECSSDSGIGTSINQEEQQQPRQKLQQQQQDQQQQSERAQSQNQQLEQHSQQNQENHQKQQTQQRQSQQQQQQQQPPPSPPPPLPPRNNQRKLHGSNYSRRCTSSNGEGAKVQSSNNDLNSSSSNEDLSVETTTTTTTAAATTIIATKATTTAAAATTCKRRAAQTKVNNKKSQKNKNNKQKQQAQQQQVQQEQQLQPQLQSQTHPQSHPHPQPHQNPNQNQNKVAKCNNNNKSGPKIDSTSNNLLDDEAKENVLPLNVNGVAKKSNDCRVTLRKICTKANALRSVSNRNIKRTALTEAKLKGTICSASVPDDIRSLSPTPSTSSSSLSFSSSSSISSSSNSNSPLSSSNSSPTNSPLIGKRNNNSPGSLLKVLKDLPPSLRSHHYYKQRGERYNIFNIAEGQLYQILEDYLVKPDDLPFYGFPVESQHEKGCVDIYKLIPKHMAKEYIKSDTKQASYCCHYYGGNTDHDYRRREERDKEFKAKVAFVTPDLVEHKFTDYTNSKQKSCVRCQKMFTVSADGEYLTEEPCIYHPGKVNAYYDGKNYVKIYTCCHADENSEGCTKHDHHIWSGLFVGMNGPYKNFVYTKFKNRSPKVYALDCEMCYTGFGPELTKITIVAYNGRIIYDHYVLPQSRIIDYCTRYSGVSESDLFSPHSTNEVKTFNQVQQDILELFDANTILIGHGLENDLRALRLVHKKIVDTSIVFSHTRGYPYRQSLKNLTKSFLNHDIQESEDGHCSQEDALATLNLMLFKIQQTWQKEMKREAPNFPPT